MWHAYIFMCWTILLQYMLRLQFRWLNIKIREDVNSTKKEAMLWFIFYQAVAEIHAVTRSPVRPRAPKMKNVATVLASRLSDSCEVECQGWPFFARKFWKNIFQYLCYCGVWKKIWKLYVDILSCCIVSMETKGSWGYATRKLILFPVINEKTHS